MSVSASRARLVVRRRPRSVLPLPSLPQTPVRTCRSQRWTPWLATFSTARVPSSLMHMDITSPLSVRLWAGTVRQFRRSVRLWTGTVRQFRRSVRLWAGTVRQFRRSVRLWAGTVRQFRRSVRLWAGTVRQFRRSVRLWAGTVRQFRRNTTRGVKHTDIQRPSGASTNRMGDILLSNRNHTRRMDRRQPRV